ncbi:hypothetical protein ACROYT_G040677 [Oculina patagonica]
MRLLLKREVALAVLASFAAFTTFTKLRINEWQQFASPYVNIKTAEDKDSVQSRFRMAMKRVPTSTTLKLLVCVIYVLFFIWQVIGLILYTIRAFETSLDEKRTSFQSMHIDTFHRSAQLQLAWVVSQIFNSALVILALSYVPSFLGWSVIPRLLVRLPAFWSLLSLYAMVIVGYGMILSQQNGKNMEIALIMVYAIDNGTQIVLIGFLNFTQINHSRRMFPFKVFAFVKINIFLLLLTYFSTFVVGSLQFALRVYGVEKTAAVSDDFFSTFVAIRRITQIVFYYKIYIFYWEKLFVDHRNILCHHDHLDECHNEIISPVSNGMV